MIRNNDKLRSLLFHIASALIPCAILTVVLWMLEAVPFGDKTILLRDSRIQYLDFVGYLRMILSGEHGIFYSFSKNLGGELLSLLSYYLVSPFNILFAFASDEGLPLMFTVVAVLKLSACGLTFFYASSKLYGCKGIHLAFSTAYALMAYNVIYGWSIMWLDGVLVLPLLGLGLYELWEGGSPRRYAFALAYGLLTNFYIGYMLCIAAVLFSLVHMLLMEGTVRKKFTAFGRFLTASCLGGFGSAFLWLPTFLALLEGRAKFDGNVQGGIINFNILGLAGKVVAGASSPVQLGTGTPHIFCGTLVLLLVMMVLLNAKVSAKKRIALFGMLLVLLLSFFIRPINIVWHGFSPNYAFNFRYAFIFNYVMIMAAQYSLSVFREGGRKPIILSGALILVLILLLLVAKEILSLDFLTAAGCLTSLGALAVVAGALMYTGNLRRMFFPLLVLVSVLEMGANCFLSWDALLGVKGTEMLVQSEYDAYHQRVTPAVEYVKELDDGFYRMEKTFERAHNDAMFFDYNGLSHFSSSQKKAELRFLEKMGLKNYMDIWAYYNTGSTADVDALLGVKYILSEEDLTQTKGYELLTTIQGIGIYHNSNALPIAMLSEASAMGVDMERRELFDLHNDIWQGISGSGLPLLMPEEAYTVSLENLQALPVETGGVRYVREDMGEPAEIRYEITISREAPLYFYFTSDGNQDAVIYINGVENGAYFSDMRWDMTNAGVYTPGETVSIAVRVEDAQVMIRDAWFYYEDLDAVASHSAAVREHPVTVEKVSDSRLRGTFEAEEEQILLFTIPYDTGWQLYIDGIRTEYDMALDALFAVEVPEGAHSFELRYVPRGLGIGCCLTAVALLGSFGWFAFRRKRKAASCGENI